MRIVDHIVDSGDRFFRGRSYLPLVVLPAFVLACLDRPHPMGTQLAGRLWQFVAVAVALFGLGVRVMAVATAPSGTSERSTRNPRASELRTSGLYSVVRHPLYVGNTLMALGLALFPGAWYLPVIVLLAAVLYYERIAAREEAFLEERFGPAFREWAAEVPAMLPRASRYRPASLRFSWRKVLRHEFHGVMVVASGALALNVIQDSFAARRLTCDRVWLITFAVCAVVFVVTIAVKRGTRLLDISADTAASLKSKV